jgi:hypothetical protein
MLEHAFVKKLPAFVMMRGQETHTYSKQDSGGLWREAECTFRFSSLNSKWMEQQQSVQSSSCL